MARNNWVWTLNNPTEEELAFLLNYDELEDPLTYLIFAEEVGAQGTPHLQGYLECRRAVRMAQVKKLLNTNRVWLHERNGTQLEAIEYVEKDGPVCEFGVKVPHRPGQRTDLEAIKEKIKAGASMWQISNDHFALWCQYGRAFEKFKTMCEARKPSYWRDVYAEVHFGVAGMGKTRTAYEEAIERVEDEGDALFALVPDGQGKVWFDGYTDQTTLILDEFTGWCPMGALLKWLDGYPLRCPTKNGFTWAKWTRVVFTSNIPMLEWYKEEVWARHPNALQRRIAAIYSWDAEGIVHKIK